MTGSPSLAGVLRNLAVEHAVGIASTNGQCGGFLHNEIAPALSANGRVLYLGDFDFAGGHIEANNRRVLESAAGPLQWERLALTAEQAEDYNLTVIMKRDGRHKGGRELPSVETEALSQTIIIEIVTRRLNELFPEPLEHIHEREELERGEVRRRLPRR